MSPWIALLRAINVGGRNLVGMSDLRDLLESLKFTDVRTLLQSGNVVFRAPARADAELETTLERATEKRLGVATQFFVRSASEWTSIISANPLRAEAKRDPGHLLVMCLKDAPARKDVEALQAAIRGPEVVRAVGRQLYLSYPAGVGRSKLTNGLIESKLRTRGTARNWNTVLKLAALVEATPSSKSGGRPAAGPARRS